jgi:hypothetical protein
MYDPTSIIGAFGWESTFYRIPTDAADNIPPVIYYDGSTPHQWLQGDIAKVEDVYYSCGDSIGCRCATDITTCPSWTVTTLDGS